MDSKPPNPGSPDATALGCTCPVLDNAFGAGAWGTSTLFWRTVGCPLHAPAPNPPVVPDPRWQMVDEKGELLPTAPLGQGAV